MKNSPLKILLVSPGCRVAESYSFGHPHLVALGSYLQHHFSCQVHIVDLDYEKLLPPAARMNIYSPAYDLIGISCYSSFEYLKSYYLGVEIRSRLPGVCLVAGGYHPSACPGDFLQPDSPFNYVVQGEGEKPLARILRGLAGGELPPSPVLGPEPVAELDELPPLDWQLLNRYKNLASRISNEVTIYLSRGCVFQCSFCMEGAKGKRGWRAFSPARAEQELRGLHTWLNLAGKNLFISDPLFGFDPGWRREMLERIRDLNLPVTSYWALSRADLLDAADLDFFRQAKFGLGFGLESGDPGMLQLIHKGGDAGLYLEKFKNLSQAAAASGLPWGANIIAGHPGETTASLYNSAAWLQELFADPAALTGFLSVDPYRFYPGSPVAEQIEKYEASYGTRVFRKNWWNYSDPGFTSQWLDPSADLDFRAKERLTAELFLPVLKRIAGRFGYRGYAADYFKRSATSQLSYLSPRQRINTIRYYYLWQELTGESGSTAASDPEVRELLKEERAVSLKIMQQKYGSLQPALYQALLNVPREKFTLSGDLWESSQDVPLALLPDNSSTLSALHAYVLNYSLLELQPGDAFLELGGGTGYGAALAAVIVGPGGRVRSLEIEPGLAAKGIANLAPYPQAEMLNRGEAELAAALEEGFNKILYCYALESLPPECSQLPGGAKLLAPVLNSQGEQILSLAVNTPDGLKITEHGEVKYVPLKN